MQLSSNSQWLPNALDRERSGTFHRKCQQVCVKHTEEEGINGFYGVTKEMVMNRAGRLNFPNQSYNFNYSNFGYAILSLILEAVYEKEYTTLMNEFIQNELKLSNTKISDQNGDLGIRTVVNMSQFVFHVNDFT